MSNPMLSPGEITKGMSVTVLRWEPIEHEPDGIFTTIKTVHQDHSWEGAILDVEAVQLPFIVVRERDGWAGARGITLDTRRVALMELSPEFVEAKTRKSSS